MMRPWQSTLIILFTVLCQPSLFGASNGGHFENGLAITAPPPGEVVVAGQVLDVTVEPRNGFLPERILIIAAPDIGDLASLRDGPYSGPVTVSFDIECNAGPGPITISASGFDASETYTTAMEVVVETVVVGNLTRLYAERDLVFYDTTPPTELTVFGEYDDCPDPRDITSPVSGTTYESSDPSIASVDEEGWVTPHGVGSSFIRIRNGELAAKAGIKVRGLPANPTQSGGRNR
jgi:hypothetical protein